MRSRVPRNIANPVRRRMVATLSTLLAFVAALVACRNGSIDADAHQAHARFPEAFRTRDWPEGDIDSPAAWRSPKGRILVFTTAKAADEVHVCDGRTGEILRTLGHSGSGAGAFERPNGVAVARDRLYVVERDNRRIQVFTLPDLRPIGHFGDDVLAKPYGIAIVDGGNRLDLYITDDYDPDLVFGADVDGGPGRVKQFRVDPAASRAEAELVRVFGRPQGEGLLYEVETILADPQHNRLFLCDETNKDIKVYDLEGNYRGRDVGKGVIVNDPEGLALFESDEAPAGGWLILSDQGKDETLLRVFSRCGRRFLGTLVADPVLANTDGVAWIPGADGSVEGGWFYAVHDDIRLHGYRGSDMLEVLPKR